MVDERSQIVVHAEAHGSGYEGHLLAPLIEATRETFNALEPRKDIFRRVKVTADSGFHSKAVVAAVEQTGADAYIADRDYHRREPAFADSGKHQQRNKKERSLKRRKEREQRQQEHPDKRRLFALQDFSYDEDKMSCICLLATRCSEAATTCSSMVTAYLQNKGMRRFTLRGRAEVDAQWQLFTVVHNSEKIAHRRERR